MVMIMITPPPDMRNQYSTQRDITMDSDSEKEMSEPLPKRQRLDANDDEITTHSNLPKEPHDYDDANSDSSADSTEDHQGGEVDRESVSGDDFSELSNLSGLDDQCNEAAWLPVAGPVAWVQRQMSLGTDPRDIIRFYLGEDFEIPPEFDQLQLWEMVVTLLLETTVQRTKLTHINTLEDVVNLLKKCQNIIVLTGAGVSVSCGIPDFRSQNGIYARLSKDFPNLPNPQSMFDINFFKSDQRPFFKFAKEIYPGQFEPSLCHKFIRLLEAHKKLLRNYTQNIDTLEKVAGVERAIECHGSFATATCMVCKYKVDKEVIRNDIFNQVIPRCPQCGPDVEGAVMKPDIVFFGESLPDEFHKQMRSDKDVCDLLIVIGSSLKVRPVSRIPSSLPANVPQIIINREPLHKQYTFDVELLGNCDDIIGELCNRLGAGWELLAKPGPPATEVKYCDLPPKTPEQSSQAEERMEGRKEGVLEHNADSGLGDLETGTVAIDTEGAVLCSDSISTSSSCSGSRGTRSNDRLERLSSSDSGAESSTAMDTHKVAAGPSLAAMSSEGHSGDVSSKFSCQHCKNNHEVNGQGDCACNKRREEAASSQHTFQAEKQLHSMEAERLVDSKEDALSPHVNRRSTQTSERRESLSVCRGPIERNVHPHRVCKDDGEEGDASEVSRDISQFASSDTFEMRQIWERRKRQSIACRCKENQIIFILPNRYIFPGAEVYSDASDESDSDNGSHLSISPITEVCEDAEENQNADSSCAYPSSALWDSRAIGQGSTSGQEYAEVLEERSPYSTPLSSPFAASDEGQPCDSQERSDVDADSVSETKQRTKQ